MWRRCKISCIGIHVAVWFAAFLPFTYSCHFSPYYLSPTPHPPPTAVSPLAHSQQTPVCDVPLPVSMSSHCSRPAYEWKHLVFDFLFLCQFAENDGFQFHLCPHKGHELIVFDGCIIFHGVYVPHFPSPVYHWWAFGLVPSLCYCEQCCNKHTCSCVFIIEWFIILWIYTQ